MLKWGRERDGWTDTDKEKWAWTKRESEGALLVPAALVCMESIHHHQINYKVRRGNREEEKGGTSVSMQSVILHPLFPPPITLSTTHTHGADLYS